MYILGGLCMRGLYRLFSRQVCRLLVGALVVAVCSVAGGAAARADSPYLYGIHWWGYTPGQPLDDGPAVLLDCPAYGGWTTETVLTHSVSWWSAAYFLGLYEDLYTNKNVSIITRIDYKWGETVPSPSSPDYAIWPASCAAVANTLRNYCHIWLIGNEPNIIGEGNNWPNNQVTPAGYAQIYRNVRNAIRAVPPGPAGPHVVLIAAPSPGGVIPGVRWMDGDQWLGQVLDHIPKNEIDGIAIHAYGGTLAQFEASYQATLAMIDSKGLQDCGVYMTEWNRAADPNQPATEADAAQFVRDAYASVHAWNQTPGRHNIVCMTWFIYDADQQAGGGWNGYSIEYWKNHGYPAGDTRDLYTAFKQAVSMRYPAGLVGSRNVRADFTASPTSGFAPLTVQFTDQSTGTISSWSWDFGDGATANVANPTHTYTAVGTYDVTLTVTGNASHSFTRTAYITVLPQPGDFDDDGDVDQEDFGRMQICLTGAGIAQLEPSCARARLDSDTDVDGDDVNLFIRCFSGPERLATPDCLP